MNILAIETSCDDTAVAILKIKNLKFEILSNIVSSQVKIHRKWGGVYPALAKREHQNNLMPVLKKALGEANPLKRTSKKHTVSGIKYKTLEEILQREKLLIRKLKRFIKSYKKPKIDLIAVTVGP